MIDKCIITDEQFKTQLRAERANYLALVKRMTNCSFIFRRGKSKLFESLYGGKSLLAFTPRSTQRKTTIKPNGYSYI